MGRRRILIPLAVALVAATACGSGGSARSTAGSPATVAAGAVKVRAAVVIRGAKSPVYLTAAPGDAKHLFVVEQSGLIRVATRGKLSRRPFLDLRRLVSTGGERGLLGLAFHPDYARNGRFFVDYTDTRGNTVVAEYHAEHGSLRAGTKARILLHISQPYTNHNGGNVVFGPDADLYIGMGDGGSGGDPGHRAQNTHVLLGKLLRIDVDHRARGRNYAIPKTNPYAKRGGAPEIYAIGLRNPWRYSFDRQTGALWIGDVGQNRFEEVDHVRKGAGRGANFGWRLFEGTSVFQPGAKKPARYVGPVATYSHKAGCSITGGYVVRDPRLPSLAGTYLYSDYCSGFIRGVRPNGSNVDLTKALGGPFGQVTSFGQDNQGRIYIVSAGGTIRLLRPA